MVLFYAEKVESFLCLVSISVFNLHVASILMTGYTFPFYMCQFFKAGMADRFENVCVSNLETRGGYRCHIPQCTAEFL